MKQKTLSIRNMILCAMFTALIAVGAFIKIPIGPVPITLQLLFTTLAGVVLGWRLGAISALLYLLLGLLGLPVFTAGGGLSYIVYPTFGFTVSFIFGTALTGYMVEKMKKTTVPKLFVACYAGLAIIYIIGVTYYYFIMNVYIGQDVTAWNAIFSCFILFIPGDIAKCLITSIVGKHLLPVLKNAQMID